MQRPYDAVVNVWLTMYGVDEVAALVLDPGYSTTRAGFAGEDTPKSIVPTNYGILSGPDQARTLFGENSLHTPLPDLEIQNPLAGVTADEWVSDWDTAAKLWEYSITSRLTGPRQGDPRSNGLNDEADGDAEMEGVEDAEKPMSDNPLLMSEPGKTSAKSREKAIQIAMEDWDVPAFWLGRSGVLSAYVNSQMHYWSRGANGHRIQFLIRQIISAGHRHRRQRHPSLTHNRRPDSTKRRAHITPRRQLDLTADTPDVRAA